MVKSNVKVYVRTRPTASNFQGLKVHQDGCSITVKLPKTEDAVINNQQDTFGFKYDGVLENVSQEALYTQAASEVVDSVLSGYSGCIFAYGQTGAGKTFTMAGDIRHYTHRGVIPRAIHQIFKEVDMRVDKLYTVQVSYLEIYNEQLYDLLAPKPGSSEGLAIMEDTVQGTYVRGLTAVTVGSEEEALAQYFVGEQGRSTAHHVLNAQSSRSHCIFTVHLTIRTSEAADERAVLSRLHLVDLAGSERTKKTGASGQTLKEAQFINRSLSFLEQAVTSLTRHEAHTPFRQSRLTNVLKDALGGNCKTVMIANIWGEPQFIEETMSTLRFASRVRQLTTDLSVAESNEPALLVKRYERQIKELKQELAMRDALSGKSRVNYDDLSEGEIKELQGLARRFMQGEVDVEALPIESVKRIREAYKALRYAAQAATAELAAQLKSAQSALPEGSVAAGNTPGSLPGSAAGQVGAVDSGAGGFQVGLAPLDARPPPGAATAHKSGAAAGGALSVQSSQHQLHADNLTSTAQPGGLVATSDLLATVSVPGGAERNEAFTRYKHDTQAGRNLNSSVKEAAAQLKEARINAKDLSASVNSAKGDIDRITAQLGLRPGESPLRGADAADAERFALIQELKGAKSRYRSAFDALKDARVALDGAASAVAAAKQELISAFEVWVATQGATALTAGLLAEGGEEDEELDAGEAFERMQLARLAANDPDSAAYHAARKKAAPLATVRASGAFGGVKGAADAMRKKEYEALINAGLAR